MSDSKQKNNIYFEKTRSKILRKPEKDQIKEAAIRRGVRAFNVEK